MIDLFSEIQSRLAAEVPELQFIDLDCQQVERQNDSYPVQFPCVLINFSADWKGKDVQQGDTVVSFRIYQQVTEDTHHSSTQKAAAFTELGLINSIHSKIQNFKGTNFGNLLRIRTEREARADGYTCIIMNYKTTYNDVSAAKVYNYQTVTPNIEVEIAIPEIIVE